MAWPLCISNCADCGVDTITLGEWYMVRPEVWEQAWAGRRKSWHGKVPGTEILCIGCLERRIGRALCCCDFTYAPSPMSARLRDRLLRNWQVSPFFDFGRIKPFDGEAAA
jgi:hypothetical protein